MKEAKPNLDDQSSAYDKQVIIDLVSNKTWMRLKVFDTVFIF